jgi:hypothetical protein
MTGRLTESVRVRFGERYEQQQKTETPNGEGGHAK